MATIEERLARMEQDIRDLQAQHAIRSTLSQYAIGVDEKRPEVLRVLFMDDAVLKIPEWSIDVSGKEEIMGFYDYYWGRFENPRRYYANEDIAVDGDAATAFMYWHVTQELGGESHLGWGTYEWGLRRRSGGWRISSVVINLLAMTTLALGWSGPNKFVDS
jgi:hypothetical protein